MIERWLSSNRHIEIEHDGHFVLGGEKHGQPIEAVRQKRIQEEVEAQIRLNCVSTFCNEEIFKMRRRWSK